MYILKKLKTKVIHYLGGYTEEEAMNAYKKGKLYAYERVKTRAKELYGFPADEWCNLLYEHILWLITETKNADSKK